MSKKKYLPYPLFLVTLALIGSGVYYFLSRNSIAQPLGINEVSSTLPAEALAACEGKEQSSSCSYRYCPPMPPCPSGRMCPQVMPSCQDRTGVCLSGACTNPSASITLSTEPTTLKLYLQSSVEFTLNANDITDKLTGAEIHLNYDPAALTITQLTTTDYLPLVLSTPQINNGHATTSFAVPVDSGGRSSGGTLAKISLRALTLGTHQIETIDTILTTVNSTSSALLSPSPIILTVYNRGDLNQDKTVDLFDYSQLIKGYGSAYTLYDYNDLLANYGKTSP